MSGDGKDLEWCREDDKDVFDDVFTDLEEGRLEDKLRLDEDIWLDGEDDSTEQDEVLRSGEDLWDDDDLADGEYPVRYRYLKRLMQLSQEVELPQAGLEGEIEAGVYVLKDCLEELESCARLGFSPGQGERPLEIIQDVVVYANHLAALIGRALGAPTWGG